MIGVGFLCAQKKRRTKRFSHHQYEKINQSLRLYLLLASIFQLHKFLRFVLNSDTRLFNSSANTDAWLTVLAPFYSPSNRKFPNRWLLLVLVNGLNYPFPLAVSSSSDALSKYLFRNRTGFTAEDEWWIPVFTSQKTTKAVRMTNQHKSTNQLKFAGIEKKIFS